MCYHIIVPRGQRQKHVLPPQGGRKEGKKMKKYCVKCGHEFESVGREVICPACKAHAAEEARKAAVLRAKKASWTGESVPVRISGRASTVIRAYSAANGLPFAQALDAMLQASTFFKSTGQEWADIVPYKSRRMQKSTDGEQDEQEVKTAGKAVKTPQAAKKAVKTASKPKK